MLNDVELKTFYCLFNKMDEKQINDFLKIKGLFYASFLDPAISALDETVENDDDVKISEYIETCTDIHDETVQKYLEQVENDLKGNGIVVVIKPTDITKNDRQLNSLNSVYKIIDSNNFEGTLLVNKNDVEGNIKLYKEKHEKGYCASDLYNMQCTIAKMLLPKMLKEFKTNIHSYPIGLTPEEWDKILLKMIWFLEETLTEKESNNLLANYNKESLEKYKQKITECQTLFGKYFLDLWD